LAPWRDEIRSSKIISLAKCSGHRDGKQSLTFLKLGALAPWQKNLYERKEDLLVEDNEVNRRLAGFLLRSQGYQVREATTAAEAFEMLKNDRPDLIVMDIQLPGMDGLEITRKLKEQPATADIPVVAVTSFAMKGDREKALAAGCAGYVTKPIDKNTFIQEVAAHMGDKPKE
jgi:CheY-like chemotaxis protein